MDLDLKIEDIIEGKVFLINKPLGWTSFDVVNKIRFAIRHNYNVKKIKVGHAGTLDPLADGLMIVCTGKATKKLYEYQDYEKEYEATIEFGKTTPSFDLETEFDKEYPTGHLTEKKINETLKTFLGETKQEPPVFSAKWIDGKRAYEMARKKKDVEMKPVLINISNIELLEINLPVIRVKLSCSKGTYIRSFAHDLGKKMESGAHLAGLKRTAIGPFKLNKAIEIERFN